MKLLDDWIKLVSRKGFVAIDCETDSLSAVEAKIVGFSMSLENSLSCYVPLAHKSLNNEKIEQIRIEDFIRVIKPMMEDLKGYPFPVMASTVAEPLTLDGVNDEPKQKRKRC